jgi:hypothetical protein
VREALTQASHQEAVDAAERGHLTRAILVEASAEVPYVAVEDGLGARTDLAQLEEGRVFRILYRRDGVVEVYYKTGEEDALGKRDPYFLRENDRWSELYQRLAPDSDSPVKWGPGEPADLEPFPSARDRNQRRREAGTTYDYLLPGRVLVLTFSPERFESDRRAEADFKAVLGAIRDTYRHEISQALAALASFSEHELVTRD